MPGLLILKCTDGKPCITRTRLKTGLATELLRLATPAPDFSFLHVPQFYPSLPSLSLSLSSSSSIFQSIQLQQLIRV